MHVWQPFVCGYVVSGCIGGVYVCIYVYMYLCVYVSMHVICKP